MTTKYPSLCSLFSLAGTDTSHHFQPVADLAHLLSAAEVIRVSSRSKAATLRADEGLDGVSDDVMGLAYFPTIRLLFTILQQSVSGSLCDAGLKKLATALPVSDQPVDQSAQKEVSLVVVESSLRLTAGGERVLLEGERGRFPTGDLAMTTAEFCKLLMGNAVHRDDALTKQRGPRMSSACSQTSPNTKVGLVYWMTSW
jgi:hypothetical protein